MLYILHDHAELGLKTLPKCDFTSPEGLPKSHKSKRMPAKEMSLYPKKRNLQDDHNLRGL